MFWQQFSGTNSIGYYAPQIFASVSTLQYCYPTTSSPIIWIGNNLTISIITGRIEQNGLLLVCHWYLRNSQGGCNCHLPSRRYRSLGPKEEFDWWCRLDCEYDVHHWSSLSYQSPRYKSQIRLIGIYRHGCDDLSICHRILSILGPSSLGVSWRG